MKRRRLQVQGELHVLGAEQGGADAHDEAALRVLS